MRASEPAETAAMEPDAAAEPAPAPGAYSWRAHRPGRYLEREGGDIWPAVWFCVKLAVLLAVGALGALLVAEGLVRGSAKRAVLGAMALGFAVRVAWQLSQWQRRVHWLEAVAEMLVVVPASLACVVLLPLRFEACALRGGVWQCAQLEWDGAWLAVGAALHVAGVALNVGSELYLRREQRAGAGLVTTGVYGAVRHPNYTGEVLLWAGAAIAGGPANLVSSAWVPACMAAGMHWWSVGDLERYLEAVYGADEVRRWALRTPAAFVTSPQHMAATMKGLFE